MGCASSTRCSTSRPSSVRRWARRLAGLLPIPEIQYLAYLHNAEDQLRGEAASLAFFSNGQYRNGMVVRVAGLAYQKGFGGHFHNDNSVAVLRDVPGLVVAVPSHPAEAPGLLRTCVGLAVEEGRVCVFLEPIALYHERDLLDGDGGWLAPYRRPRRTTPTSSARVTVHGTGEDLLLVTFGNGVRMCAAGRRSAASVRESSRTVLDLRWLAPLPSDGPGRAMRGASGRVLVVDETRVSGGVAEGVLAALSRCRLPGSVRGSIASRDSFVPLGPALALVLVSEDDIVRAALAPTVGLRAWRSAVRRSTRSSNASAMRPLERTQPLQRSRTVSDIAERGREILERLGVGDPFDARRHAWLPGRRSTAA